MIAITSKTRNGRMFWAVWGWSADPKHAHAYRDEKSAVKAANNIAEKYRMTVAVERLDAMTRVKRGQRKKKRAKNPTGNVVTYKRDYSGSGWYPVLIGPDGTERELRGYMSIQKKYVATAGPSIAKEWNAQWLPPGRAVRAERVVYFPHGAAVTDAGSYANDDITPAIEQQIARLNTRQRAEGEYLGRLYRKGQATDVRYSDGVLVLLEIPHGESTRVKTPAMAIKWIKRRKKARAENPVPPSRYQGKHRPAAGAVAAAGDLFRRFTGHEPHKAKTVSEKDHAWLRVGTVDGILYTTNRDNGDGGEVEKYIHKFAPGSRPELLVSHDGKVFRSRAGQFTFTDRGFVDENKAGEAIE